MTYKFYISGTRFTAVNSEHGYIQFKKDLECHSILVGIDHVLCQEVILNDEEIDSELFFDSLDYPVAVLHNAIQFFKKGDPEFRSTSQRAKERHDYYLELKSKQYH